MRHRKTLYTKALLMTMCFIACTVATATIIGIGPNIDDIRGLPSTVALRVASRRVHRSRLAYDTAVSRVKGERYSLYQRSRERNARSLALASRVTTTKRIPTVVASNGHRTTVFRTVAETPYQNLVLAFANPEQEPVVGMHLTALVHIKDKPDRPISGLVTGQDGTVTLPKLGPLPVTVDLALTDRTADAPSVAAPSAREAQSDGPTEGEWRFADVTTASIPILAPKGTPIATVASLPYEVASLVPVASNRRAVVWQYRLPAPIVVNRTVADVDITAPPGASLTSPALGGTVVVPATGHAVCQLPLSAMGDGPVPIRVAEELPAGEAEAVITGYACDPYHSQTVVAPDLTLVRIKNVNLTHQIGVMDNAAGLTQAFGPAIVSNLGDGSKSWEYAGQGVQYGVRELPFGDDGPSVVEWVRIVGPTGGSVGGITVGSPAGEVTTAFGKPSDTSAAPDGATVMHFLDDGLRLVVKSGHVQSILFRRRTELLDQGTTAFVAKAPSRLYVQSYEGNGRAVVADVVSLKRYLGQLPSIRLVDSPDQADLVLTARIVSFTDHRGQIVSGLPYSYTCTTRLVYNLMDVDTGKYLCREKLAEATASADYTKETVAGGVTVAALLLQKNTLIKGLGGLLGVGGVVELNKAVQHAVNRCPSLAAETVFDQMIQDIDKASDFSARITAIDYENGTMKLNLGTEDGVSVSTPDRPSAFRVAIDRRGLPGIESGNSDDYYTAVVVGAGPHTATCQLHHVIRKVNRARESVTDTVDEAMLERIPQPATGEVSASSDIRFPPLPVISDADVEAATQVTQQQPPNQPSSSTKKNQGALPTITVPKIRWPKL